MKPRALCRWIWAVTFNITLLSPAFAVPVLRPLEVADATGVRVFAPLQPLVAFAPDGTQLSYTVCDPRLVPTRTDVRMDALRVVSGCSIWTRGYAESDVHNSSAATHIEHSGAAWAPSWSPDSRQLAFYAVDAGVVHLWIWDRTQRTAHRASEEIVNVKIGGEFPLWSADGKHIFTKLTAPQAPPTRPAPDRDASVPAWAAPASNGAKVVVLRSDPHAATNSTARETFYDAVDMAAIDVVSGTAQRLSKGVRVASYRLSPDRRYLAYSHQTDWRMSGARVYRWDLDLIDLDTAGVRTLASFDQFHGNSYRWSPDSRSLAYFSGAGESSAALFVVGVDATKPRQLEGTANFNTALWHFPVWSSSTAAVYAIDEHTLWRGEPDSGRVSVVGTWPQYDLLRIVTTGSDESAWLPDGGRTLYVNARDRRTKRGEVLGVDLTTGAVHALRDERFSLEGYSTYPVVSPSGRRLIYLGQSGQHPPDLWMASTDFKQRERLTTLNPEFDAYTLGEQRLIEFRGLDGTPLQATLLLPAGYEKGRRYPLVAWVYGGDNGSDSVNHFGLTSLSAFNMQMLATHGYAVLYPDIPLTTGQHVKSLVNAVMPAVDAAIDAGIADAERLAVMGESAGGYATLALVTQTNRFKAAVMCAGFGDLASFYGHGWQAWLETGKGAIGAAPWQAPRLYVENSPIYYLNRIRTPLLIEAGAQDASVGEFPKETFTSLLSLEKDATYLSYDGEGHVLNSHPNLVDFWNRTAAFLDSYLQ